MVDQLQSAAFQRLLLALAADRLLLFRPVRMIVFYHVVVGALGIPGALLSFVM
jgi:hypothetical protein